MDRGAWGLRFTGSQRVKHGWSDWTHTQRFSHTSLLRYGNDNFMYFHLAAKVTCVYPRKRGNYRNIFTWKYTLAITPKTQNNNSQHFGILCCGVLFYADFKLRSYNIYRFILYIMTLLLHYSFDVSVFLNSVADFYSLKVKVAQLCPTLCDPMDCTVHEIL